MALIYHSGYVFKDDGTAVEGATVQLYQTDSTTLVTVIEGGTSVTTDSDGYYTASVTEVGATSGYDVKITSGSSVRYRRGNDRLQIEELDIRNDQAATQGGLFVANTHNSSSVKAATFAGMRTTANVADNDEIYMSFEMKDSGGALHEYARITAIATDVTATEEDGALVFYVADTDNSGNLQEALRLSSSTAGTVSATTTSVSQFNNTITVGVDDTGYDVKFFGASAGAYMLWDESLDQLIIMGKSADAADSSGNLLLATSLTDVNANDVLGKIEFKAAHEAGGGDSTTVAAAVEAVAQGTFSSSVNATDIIFKTGHSEAATEKFRFTFQGEIGIGGATYGSSGDVLTSGGAGAAPTWETPTTGDITAVSLTGDSGGALSVASGAAGFTLTGGAGIDTAGSSTTITFTLDLNELTDTAIANGDYIIFTDATDSNATVKGDLADVATLFAGTGLTASSSVIGVDASQTQITSVGALNAGSITSGFTSIDVGSGAISTTGAVGTGALTVGGVVDITDATDSSDATGDTGALRTEGGASIAKKLYVGTDLDVDGTAELDNITIGGAQGSDGQVLTSTGSAVAWEDAAGGGASQATATALALIF